MRAHMRGRRTFYHPKILQNKMIHLSKYIMFKYMCIYIYTYYIVVWVWWPSSTSMKYCMCMCIYIIRIYIYSICVYENWYKQEAFPAFLPRLFALQRRFRMKPRPGGKLWNSPTAISVFPFGDPKWGFARIPQKWDWYIYLRNDEDLKGNDGDPKIFVSNCLNVILFHCFFTIWNDEFVLNSKRGDQLQQKVTYEETPYNTC